MEQPDADEEGHGAAGEDEVEGGDEDADAERSGNNAKDNREGVPACRVFTRERALPVVKLPVKGCNGVGEYKGNGG